MEKITAKDNKKIKHVMALMEKSKLRRSEDLFVAEGERMVLETPQDLLQESYVSETYLSSGREAPIGAVCVSDSVMKHMSGTTTPQGIMAVVRRPHYIAEDILGNTSDSSAPLVLVLEDVTYKSKPDISQDIYMNHMLSIMKNSIKMAVGTMLQTEKQRQSIVNQLKKQ